MKVKVLVSNIGFNGVEAGKVIEVENEQAQGWIKRGIAEEVKAPVKKAPAKPKTTKTPAQK